MKELGPVGGKVTSIGQVFLVVHLTKSMVDPGGIGGT